MSEPDCDLAVIGAGPAGSEIAYRVAGFGFRVVVLEQERLDREKACGGGIQACELREFGPLPEGVVERVIRRTRVISPAYRVLEVTDADASPAGRCGVTVRRSVYDRHLQRRAEAAGAEFREATRVTGIRARRGVLAITTRARTGPCTLTARLVADAAGSGAAGITRMLGIPEGEPEMCVTRFVWAAIPDIEQSFADAHEFYYLDRLADGYAWIFPKRDVLSVGVGATEDSLRRNAIDLKACLREFMDAHPVAAPKLAGYQIVRSGGGAIRFGILPRLHGRRAVVLGDAAGLANIVHGGGIYHARKSAALAAPHCVAFLQTDNPSCLERYDTEARRFFEQHEMEWDRRIRQILWNPRLVGRLVEKGQTDRTIRRAVSIVLTSSEPHERAYRILERHMLETIYEGLADTTGFYRDEIGERLRAVFTRRDVGLHRRANEVLLNPRSKRLRAFLGVLAAEMFGGCRDEALNFSLIYEVFHTASLVHDDIMDRSARRRGRRTLNARYGLDEAIIVGDLMLARGYSLIAQFSCGDSISKAQLVAALAVVGDAGEQCCIGQSQDMDAARRRRYGRIDRYLQMAERKTGSLIAGAVQGGAVMSGASADQVETIGRFGRCLGVAFQIIDDSLDLLGGAAANKSVMNDLKQAKATPMLVHALTKADSRDRTTIESAVGNPRMTVRMAARVLSIYRKHDAIAYAQRLSHEYVLRSRDELAKLPAGDARDRFGAILDVLDYWSLSCGKAGRAPALGLATRLTT